MKTYRTRLTEGEHRTAMRWARGISPLSMIQNNRRGCVSLAKASRSSRSRRREYARNALIFATAEAIWQRAEDVDAGRWPRAWAEIDNGALVAGKSKRLSPSEWQRRDRAREPTGWTCRTSTDLQEA